MQTFKVFKEGKFFKYIFSLYYLQIYQYLKKTKLYIYGEDN